MNKKILSNYYTRMVDWMKITELEEEELYEIRLYVNFIPTDGLGLKEFEEDMKMIVEKIEENTLLKVDNEYYISVIEKVDVIDATLEIILMCEKINRNRKDGKA